MLPKSAISLSEHVAAVATFMPFLKHELLAAKHGLSIHKDPGEDSSCFVTF
jgi:hypothetical protein